MPTDNVVLSPGSGGSSMRTLADASSNEWPTAVLCYATTVSAGANVLQVVTPSFGLPVAQQGTWTVQPGNTANTTAWKVDASATTQPVSAVSLPLPSGASTAVKQPALGVAGTASADVLTVQGIASMTALKVDGSGVTQPVSGTFWQATQPISGTVTADQGGSWSVTVGSALPAGTNVIGHIIVDSGVITSVTSITNALPSGTNVIGHVIVDSGTITSVTAITNALPSGTNVIGHVIVDSGTITTVSTVTAVTTVSTVTAVTAITNALPAGTNLLGQISASDETGTIYSGTTALTPKFAIITASSSGATTIVSAVTSKKIRVLRWSLSSNGTVNIKWQSHVTPTDITGLHYLTQYASAGGAYCPQGIFQTISGEALDINLSASIAVGGELTYLEIP